MYIKCLIIRGEEIKLHILDQINKDIFGGKMFIILTIQL